MMFLVTVILASLVTSVVPQNLPPQIVDHSNPIIQIRNGASTMVFCTIRYLGDYEVTFQRLTTGTTGNVRPNVECRLGINDE